MFSFPSYKVNRRFPLSRSLPPFLLLLHLYLCKYYTSLSLLFLFLLLYLSNFMPLYNFHTTCYTTALSPGNSAPGFPASLFPCNHTLYTPQILLLLWVLSTLPCTLPLLLGTAPLLYCVSLPSPILLTVVLLLLSFFSFSLDTPTSCVPLPHIQNISLLLSLFLASSPHTASLNFPALQIY